MNAAQIRRTREMIQRDGDRCTLCGRRFSHLDFTYTMRRGRKLHVVGECCVGRGLVEGGGIYLAAPARETLQ